MLRRTIALVLAAAASTSGAVLVTPPPAGAVTLTYTINDLGDAADAAPGNDVCATAGGTCTLRAAITEANANTADDNRIQFSVAGTITVSGGHGGLPVVGDPGLVIDGTTAPGYAVGSPTVTIVGTGTTIDSGPTALEVEAPDFTVKGLRWGNWNRVLRLANTAPRAVVEGNQMGTNGTAYTDALKIGFGIDVSGDSTRIGGPTAAQRNQIAGFKARGIDTTTGATNLLVEGNYIGTNAAGTAAIAHPNGTTGIEIGGQQTLNVAVEAGTPTTIVRGNLISGNPGYALAAPQASGMTVVGNLIGTDVTGALPLGNTGVAIAAEKGAHIQVGGTGPGDGNVIAATKSVLIVGFEQGAGILLRQSATATVQGNVIGTNAAGATGLMNQGDGVLIQDDGTNLTLGGTAAGAGNTIVSAGSGLRIRSLPAGQTVQATVQGNRFGTNPAGTAKVGAGGGNGVTVECGGKATIGGTAAGAGNLLSGHKDSGVLICDGRRGTTVQGNRIGTNAAGTAAIANNYGVRIFTPSNTSTFASTPLLIGGTAAGAGNLISGNTQHGADLAGLMSFQGNTVGLNAAGTAPIPNLFAGVDVGLGTTYGVPTIGGSAPGAGNTISGNMNSGIIGGVNGFVVQGNRIGTDPTGTTLIGNEFAGVFVLGPTSGTIGGTGTGEGNLIAGNGRQGVFVLPNTSGIAIRGNRIYDNAMQSIELFQFGPDGGGNKDQLPPTMTAVVGAQTAVSGTIKTNVAGPLTIDVYASDQCGAEGGGEARERLGTLTVNHPGGGAATAFAGNVGLPSSGNTVITATATVTGNGTSQFSHCTVVTDLDAKATANATQIPVGDTVGTLLSITNNGPTAATGVVMELQPNVGSQSAADSQVLDPPTKGTIAGTTWTVGSLAVGETASVCGYQTAVRSTWEYEPGTFFPASMYPGLKVAAATPSNDPYTGNDEWTAGTGVGPRQAGANVCAPPTLAIGDASLTRPTSGTATMTFPVTLSKAGGRPVTVAYTTQNGTAAAVIDYQARSGTVTIPAGQTTGSIQVPIVGNQSDEPDKAFQVVLSSPTVATIADGTATGTVKANGALAGCPVDADGNETFVCHLYWDALGRQAEPGGFAYWVKRLDGGDPRSTMVKTYLSQAESRRVLVDRVYVFYLGRHGTATELRTWADRLAARTTTPEAIRIELLASSEYDAKAGSTKTGWVRSVYRNVFRRDPDSGGQAYWVGKLDAGQTRAQVAKAMLTQDEGRRRVIDDIFLRFLRRLPPMSESQPYVTQMKAGRTEADVANAVAASAEYYNRP